MKKVQVQQPIAFNISDGIENLNTQQINVQTLFKLFACQSIVVAIKQEKRDALEKLLLDGNVITFLDRGKDVAEIFDLVVTKYPQFTEILLNSDLKIDVNEMKVKSNDILLPSINYVIRTGNMPLIQLFLNHNAKLKKNSLVVALETKNIDVIMLVVKNSEKIVASDFKKIVKFCAEIKNFKLVLPALYKNVGLIDDSLSVVLTTKNRPLIKNVLELIDRVDQESFSSIVKLCNEQKDSSAMLLALKRDPRLSKDAVKTVLETGNIEFVCETLAEVKSIDEEDFRAIVDLVFKNYRSSGSLFLALRNPLELAIEKTKNKNAAWSYLIKRQSEVLEKVKLLEINPVDKGLIDITQRALQFLLTHCKIKSSEEGLNVIAKNILHAALITKDYKLIFDRFNLGLLLSQALIMCKNQNEQGLLRLYHGIAVKIAKKMISVEEVKYIKLTVEEVKIALDVVMLLDDRRLFNMIIDPWDALFDKQEELLRQEDIESLRRLHDIMQSVFAEIPHPESMKNSQLKLQNTLDSVLLTENYMSIFLQLCKSLNRETLVGSEIFLYLLKKPYFLARNSVNFSAKSQGLLSVMITDFFYDPRKIDLNVTDSQGVPAIFYLFDENVIRKDFFRKEDLGNLITYYKKNGGNLNITDKGGNSFLEKALSTRPSLGLVILLLQNGATLTDPIYEKSKGYWEKVSQEGKKFLTTFAKNKVPHSSTFVIIKNMFLKIRTRPLLGGGLVLKVKLDNACLKYWEDHSVTCFDLYKIFASGQEEIANKDVEKNKFFWSSFFGGLFTKVVGNEELFKKTKELDPRQLLIKYPKIKAPRNSKSVSISEPKSYDATVSSSAIFNADYAEDYEEEEFESEEEEEEGEYNEEYEEEGHGEEQLESLERLEETNEDTSDVLYSPSGNGLLDNSFFQEPEKPRERADSTEKQFKKLLLTTMSSSGGLNKNEEKKNSVFDIEDSFFKSKKSDSKEEEGDKDSIVEGNGNSSGIDLTTTKFDSLFQE